MSVLRNGQRAWGISWVHIALALAVGAGVPLLWLWFAPPATPATVAVAFADARTLAVQPQGDMAPRGNALAQGPALAVPPSPASQADSMALVSAPLITRMRDPHGDQSPDITDFINNGEVPTMAEVISRLHAAGVRSGLGAFNPPGTRAPLIGIAVGEDFELPPGYVRHHQFTDDGQRIEPILMFSPDHPLVAAVGQAARPHDLVVPPALAPPGLPIRHIVLPPAIDAATEPRK